jgi:hypothetical protein
MNDLLKLAVNAHGGLPHWNKLNTIEAHISIGGAIWDFKGQPGLLADVTFRSAIHNQDRVVFDNFGGAGQRSVFRADLVRLETAAGQLVEERADPRSKFVLADQWDRVHAAYFSSYALWNYLTQPFVYTMPGFATEEIAPWEEQGETWRRLKIRYPDHPAGHGREQISYFGADGLLRRHDYTVDILGGATGANYPSDYRNVDGIMLPMKRRIYAQQADGQKAPEPLLVSIDISEARFK